jgi:hypothetical protein
MALPFSGIPKENVELGLLENLEGYREFSGKRNSRTGWLPSWRLMARRYHLLGGGSEFSLVLEQHLGEG